MSDAPRHVVRILYTNHRGEKAWRTIEPHGIHFDVCEWHPGEQWLLEAYDLDKKEMRSFAMKDISAWEVAS